MFVPGIAREVGRGGRYRIDAATPGMDSEATGFTLYVDTLRELLPEAARGKRVFIADGISETKAGALRAEGYITVNALSEYGHDEEEARRQGCGFVYKDGKVKALK
jgi:ATP phosphoribosyltransferase regulatory subunit